MSQLKAKLSESMKAAMKGGDKQTLLFARNLHAAIRKKEIDEKKDLTDADVAKLVSSIAKQRQESISQYRQGGREDLVGQEEAELKFLMEYLPPQLSREELEKLVDQTLQETGATTAKEIGKVMQSLVAKVQGRADGKLVNELVRSKLK